MEVRVGDKRFDRHYRRIRLGLRLMSHGARVQMASDWSGMTRDRATLLCQRWMADAEDGFRSSVPDFLFAFFLGSA